MEKESAKKTRYINPPNKLKQKVGGGGIDAALLLKSQEYIHNNAIDFTPIAQDFLNEMKAQAKQFKKGRPSDKDGLIDMIKPVMQLKANGGMFRYQLISDVADIALQFLEQIDDVNEECIEVLIAHQKVIEAILTSKLQGDGGNEGYELVKELDQVCRRYFTKYGKKEEKPEKKPKKK